MFRTLYEHKERSTEDLKEIGEQLSQNFIDKTIRFSKNERFKIGLQTIKRIMKFCYVKKEDL